MKRFLTFYLRNLFLKYTHDLEIECTHTLIDLVINAFYRFTTWTKIFRLKIDAA